VFHPGPTLDYLATLEWIAATENLLPGRPGRNGQEHVLVALGVAAVHAGHKVRYFTAADLTEALYRGLADNSVGRIIENLLRNDLVLVDEVGFAPLDDTGAQLLFRFVSAPTNAARSASPALAIRVLGRFLPEHTTAVSLLDRLLHHANVVVTAGDSYRMRQARPEEEHPEEELTNPRGGTFNWPPAGTATWPLTRARTRSGHARRPDSCGLRHQPHPRARIRNLEHTNSISEQHSLTASHEIADRRHSNRNKN